MRDERLSVDTAGGKDQQPHIKDYFRLIFRRRWILISAFLATVVGTTLWVLLQTPIYRAQGLLLIEPMKVNLTNFKAVYDPTLGGVGELSRREFYETQYKLILCRPILEKAFVEFEFGNMKDFRELKDPIIPFSKLFSVEPVRRSRLVWVNFEWKDPELAAKVLDYIMSEYIYDYRRRTLGVTMGGLRALREKADELRPKVEAKADELQEFMVQNNMVSLEKTQNIVVDRLKEINKNLSDVERQRIEYDSICRNIKQALENRQPLEEMPEMAGSSSIRDLKLEYIRTKQECNDLDGRFGPNHPEVHASRSRLRTVAEKIQEEMRTIFASTQAQLDRAESQTRELRHELSDQEQRVMTFNKVAIRYNMLKEGHDTLNKTYKAIAKRIEEVEIAMASGSEDDNIFVITHPRIPVKPSKPRKRFSVAVAGFAGLSLGLLLCFFIDYLDTTIKTKEDAESFLEVPVLGYVPAIVEEETANAEGRGLKAIELLPQKNPRSIGAESFRSIRTALAFSAADGKLRSMLVTSPSPSEGKTLISVNIAASIAQSGKRVLIVDADMRKPRLHKVFSVSSGPGLSNLLVGEKTSHLKDLAHPVSGIPNLFFLPCGPLPPNPSELIGSTRMKELIAEAGKDFDVTIFDTSPVIAVTDTAVLCKYIDGAMIVVRSFRTQKELARRTKEILSHTHGKILGVVLNNVDMPRHGYYYYSGYYYSQYHYYYGEDKDKKPNKRRWLKTGTQRT